MTGFNWSVLTASLAGGLGVGLIRSQHSVDAP